jgi:hypothetical protein
MWTLLARGRLASLAARDLRTNGRGATVVAMTLKARVRAGRLIVDEPTDLPEGTVIELLPLDPGDWLDEEDRAALHQALKDSDEDIKAGRLVDADVILRELRSR